MMPVDNKYETVIKPNFERIRKLKSSGATDKDIYTAIGISKAVWCKYKKDNKDFKDLLNNKESINQNLDDTQERLDNLPSKELYKEKIARLSYYDDNASLDTTLKGFRQLYPEENHYLQVEHKKLNIEQEKMEMDKNNINIKTQTVVGSDLINMIAKVADPHKFRE